MITLILATDMARHGEILANFKDKIDTFDFTKDEHLTSVSDEIPSCRASTGSDLLQYKNNEMSNVTASSQVRYVYDMNTLIMR